MNDAREKVLNNAEFLLAESVGKNWPRDSVPCKLLAVVDRLCEALASPAQGQEIGIHDDADPVMAALSQTIADGYATDNQRATCRMAYAEVNRLRAMLASAPAPVAVPVAWVVPMAAAMLRRFHEASGALDSVQVTMFSSPGPGHEHDAVYLAPPPADLSEVSLPEAVMRLPEEWRHTCLENKHVFADELEAALTRAKGERVCVWTYSKQYGRYAVGCSVGTYCAKFDLQNYCGCCGGRIESEGAKS